MDQNATVASLVNQAMIALTQQNHTNALNAYAAALRIARELKRSRLIAVILNHVGDTFQAQGEIQDAVIAYEAALRALESEDELKLDSVRNCL
ncbi:tetratricopeptide repeat protein [Leptolyngbya sp. ST-U4]|uniref:tetratricopeptide repeat protein n=1 Tax=Leptolyngbya sp. ST-U4 TaxID=2933912 RepID=UPI003297D7A9